MCVGGNKTVAGFVPKKLFVPDILSLKLKNSHFLLTSCREALSAVVTEIVHFVEPCNNNVINGT